MLKGHSNPITFISRADLVWITPHSSFTQLQFWPWSFISEKRDLRNDAFLNYKCVTYIFLLRVFKSLTHLDLHDKRKLISVIYDEVTWVLLNLLYKIILNNVYTSEVYYLMPSFFAKSSKWFFRFTKHFFDIFVFNFN